MESSKSDSESPDQAEFRGDNKCAQCMQVLYLQSEQVNGIHNLEDIHIQSSTSTATVHVLNCMDTLVFITIVMWKDNRVESINPPNTD